MTQRATFTAAEIKAVERAAKAGVRLALIARPDGTKIIAPAADIDLPAATNDLDDRLAAFGGA